jgi:hypothetical protein
METSLKTFNIESRPLLFSKKDVVVSWSPKSACSHVAVWFFLKQGLLPAVNYYHSWPHKFRAEVYYKSATYQRRVAAVEESNGGGFTLLKVTRDPTKRLVSIFRHVCRHTFMHDEIRRKLKLNAARDGLSLRDFQKLLKRENLLLPSKVNVHLCGQYHPVWDMNFDRTVTLNMDTNPLNPSLNEIEAELDIPPTHFDNVPKFNQLRESHYAKEQEFEGATDIESHKFKASETTTFPKKALLASPLMQQMAKDFYPKDFGAVDTLDTAGKLFT